MGIHYTFGANKGSRLMEKKAKREKRLAEKRAKKQAKLGKKKSLILRCTIFKNQLLLKT